MSKKILIICPYPINVAPSQRLKYEQYFSFWEENGYEIEVSPFMTKGFWQIVYKKGFYFQKLLYTLWGYLRRFRDIFRIRKYDVIYIHLWATPFGFPLFETFFCLLHKKIIYDIDDMIHLKNKSQANTYLSHFKGKQKVIYLIKKASHIIACTPSLEQFVKQYNSEVTDISSTINTNIYSLKEHTAKNVITIGWSGSHSTSKYLYLIEEALKEVKEKINCQILVIGDPTFKFKDLESKTIEWNEKTEVETLKKIDIGLYPLPDEPWVYGKSGLKALQYMALGIPTIASAIGTNFRIIKDGETGFLVRTEKEWKEKILLLASDVELRKEMGRKSRAFVESFYSVNANKNKYLQIIEKVISSPTHDDKAHS